MELQEADHDGKITSMAQVEVDSDAGKSSVLERAREDIERTRQYIKPFWLGI